MVCPGTLMDTNGTLKSLFAREEKRRDGGVKGGGRGRRRGTEGGRFRLIFYAARMKR